MIRSVNDFKELKQVQFTIELLFSIFFELCFLAIAFWLFITWDYFGVLLIIICFFGFFMILVYSQQQYFRIIRDIEMIFENDNFYVINIQKRRRIINDFIEFQLASQEDEIGFPEGLELIYKLNNLSDNPGGGWREVYFKFPFNFPFLINQFDIELKEFEEPAKELKRIELVRVFSNDLQGKFFEIVLNFPMERDLQNIHEQIQKILEVAKTLQNISSQRIVNLLPLQIHPRILASFRYFSFHRVCIQCENVFLKMKYDRKSMLPERCPDCNSMTVSLARQLNGITIQEKIRRIRELGIVVKNPSGYEGKAIS